MTIWRSKNKEKTLHWNKARVELVRYWCLYFPPYGRSINVTRQAGVQVNL